MIKMKLLSIFAISFLIFASAVATCVQAEEKSLNFIIVVDAHHNPVMLNFTKAFNALNASLNGRIVVFYNNDTITETTLSGVAAFVIPPFNKTFSDQELEAIRKYIYRGGILIMLALDHDPDRGYNMDSIVFDDLLSGLPLKERPKLNYTTGGVGLRCIDPLSNDSFLRLNSSKHFTEALRSKYLRGREYNLILQSTVFTIRTEDMNKTPAVVPPKWTYCLSGDKTLYFESGGVVFYIGEYGQGHVLLFGFAVSISDIENAVYQKPWIELGDNKEFWVDVISSLIKPATEESVNIRLEPIAIASIIVGVMITAVGLSMIYRDKKARPKKKKEVSIAEVLRQIRKER